MEFPILKSNFNFTEWTFLILRNDRFELITIKKGTPEWQNIVPTDGPNILYAKESTYTYDGEHVLEATKIEINLDSIP